MSQRLAEIAEQKLFDQVRRSVVGRGASVRTRAPSGTRSRRSSGWPGSTGSVGRLVTVYTDVR